MACQADARPQPEQFAEHLADLGRGDEVAARAERIARDVVAVVRMGQAHRHELPDRDRSGALNALSDFNFERRLGHGADFRRWACRPAMVGCFSAKAMKPKPASISGIERSMAHGGAAPQEAELRIGLAEELADDARDPIAHREQRR